MTSASDYERDVEAMRAILRRQAVSDLEKMVRDTIMPNLGNLDRDADSDIIIALGDALDAIDRIDMLDVEGLVRLIREARDTAL